MLGTGGEALIDRDLLRARANEIDRTIRRLEALRDGLRHAADCPAPSHGACPTFRRLTRVAAGRVRSGRKEPAVPGA